ncbi:MAG: VanW family protein [Lysobacter sp.]|nr:VanW family protein [Lysobacter sp.]
MLRRLFRALPDTPRARLLQLRMHTRDAVRSDARFARVDTPHALPQRHAWTQVIHDTPTAEAKRHNLRLAADALQRTRIAPDEVFSFARVVGPPIASRGYRAGRTLVGGEVAASIGGGLCQLSGLLYLASLECGLEILERHPHSLDIYTDATRFAPLGADATVVYGHRDLRFRNTLELPIGFACEVDAGQVTLSLCASHAPARRSIAFIAEPQELHMLVTTVVDGEAILQQCYRTAADA